MRTGTAMGGLREVRARFLWEGLAPRATLGRHLWHRCRPTYGSTSTNNGCPLREIRAKMAWDTRLRERSGAGCSLLC